MSILLIELKGPTVDTKQTERGKAREEELKREEIPFTIQFQLFSYFHADFLLLFTPIRTLQRAETTPTTPRDGVLTIILSTTPNQLYHTLKKNLLTLIAIRLFLYLFAFTSLSTYYIPTTFRYNFARHIPCNLNSFIRLLSE